MPTDEELQRLYSDDYFEKGLHGLDRAEMTYEDLSDKHGADSATAVAAYLRRYHSSAESVFEIGAAMGHFLNAARQAGYTCSGVEISDSGVAAARRKFGIELIQGNIETIDLSDQAGRWDIVYCGDLLEHVRDPDGVLAKAAKLLRPGGVCLVRVPGTFNLLATRLAVPLLRLAGREKQLPDKPYHLYEFTTDTVRRVFGRHFGTVHVENEATQPWRLNLKTGSPDYLLKYVLQWLNWPLTKLANRYGDRMTIVAGK